MQPPSSRASSGVSSSLSALSTQCERSAVSRRLGSCRSSRAVAKGQQRYRPRWVSCATGGSTLPRPASLACERAPKYSWASASLHASEPECALTKRSGSGSDPLRSATASSSLSMVDTCAESGFVSYAPS